MIHQPKKLPVANNDNSNIKVKSSTIEGLGLYVVHAFNSGEKIRKIKVIREVTPESPLREDLDERHDHCNYADGKVFLIGFPDRHINHSCDPNTYLHYETDACYIVARRHIATGEELTCDYNINITGGTAWTCHCGATRCRGTSTGDFFLLPIDIQREYLPFLAEWFVRRHAGRLAKLY